MGVNDGTVIGITQIVDNGDPGERFNLVLVAEGYKESELGTFHSDANHFVNGLFATKPFSDFPCAINVYRVDVTSTDSGADDPVSCGGTGAVVNTYFDAHFCTYGLRRALTCNTSLVQTVVGSLMPEYHSAQVIVNSPIYGGYGGTVGTSSTATVNSSTGNPVDWREILIHEMGHSIFHLADEYEYLAGCDVSEPAQNVWSFGEPGQPNITASPTASGKWSDLVNTSTLPTTSNANCSQCDPQPSPGSSIVGTFAGGYHYHCGIYRPQFNCKMRKLGEPFCAVCQRVIREFLLPFDPSFCLRKIDLSRWVAVATILFGVIQDGGGVIIVGGKPIPIDPWGPLRHSLWGALANPDEAPAAMRDTLVGLALLEVASLISSPEGRERVEAAAKGMLDKAVGELPSGTIR